MGRLDDEIETIEISKREYGDLIRITTTLVIISNILKAEKYLSESRFNSILGIEDKGDE